MGKSMLETMESNWVLGAILTRTCPYFPTCCHSSLIGASNSRRASISQAVPLCWRASRSRRPRDSRANRWTSRSSARPSTATSCKYALHSGSANFTAEPAQHEVVICQSSNAPLQAGADIIVIGLPATGFSVAVGPEPIQVVQDFTQVVLLQTHFLLKTDHFLAKSGESIFVRYVKTVEQGAVIFLQGFQGAGDGGPQRQDGCQGRFRDCRC